MTEPLVLVVTVIAAAFLLRPILDRLPAPRWYARARERGRPGIPVTMTLVAALVLAMEWMIGERRGVFGGILLILWIGAPLAAWRVFRSWYRRPHGPREVTPK
jgi:multisubunit Na+/H+ antiporter MnhG subunit